MSLREKLKTLGQQRAHALVLGLGRSGAAAGRFLTSLGMTVSVVEKKTRDEFIQHPRFGPLLAETEQRGIEVLFNNALPQQFERAALCVMSPGVPMNSEVPCKLRDAGVSQIGELELGIEFSSLPAIVLTGSNGKSTTVSMIDALLRFPSSAPLLCGNIGTPIMSLLGTGAANATVLVAEASSYQLETCSVLKPKIGVLLNLSENHLERHGTMEAYRAAKWRIFERQDEGNFAVIGGDDPALVSLAKSLPARVAVFGSLDGYSASLPISQYPYKALASPQIARVWFNSELEEYDLSVSALIGSHNALNWAAAILTARLMGAPAEWIQRTIGEFRGLAHRLEVVRNDNGILIINDSKSTTPAATAAAIRAVYEQWPQRSLTVLIGGEMKRGSWDVVAEACRATFGAPHLIAFGGDHQRVYDELRKYGIEADRCTTMANAVSCGLARSAAGGILLLSPGCGSFDEFADFEARGDMFRSLACRR